MCQNYNSDEISTYKEEELCCLEQKINSLRIDMNSKVNAFDTKAEGATAKMAANS